VPFYGWGGQTSFDALEATSFIGAVVPILVALCILASLAAALMPGSIPSRLAPALPPPLSDQQRHNGAWPGEQEWLP
jgi:hypothetical protein